MYGVGDDDAVVTDLLSQTLEPSCTARNTEVFVTL